MSFFGKQTRALRLRRFPDFKVGFVPQNCCRREQVSWQFPFLQGRLRTHHDADAALDKKEFPFLQGRLRTFWNWLIKITAVGFPFLQGRLRTVEAQSNTYSLAEFPFLQGRLRTGTQEPRRGGSVMFPFLQGRLRTKIKLKVKSGNYMFPFLQGRLRTWKGCLRSTRLSSFHSFKVGFVPVNTASILSLIFRVVKGFFRAFLTKFR